MKQILSDFRIIPSVVRADERTTVTVCPQGENSAFVPGHHYTVTVRDMERACAYYDAFPAAVYDCTPDEDGCLRFTHFFDGEQNHSVVITRPEEEEQVSLYHTLTNRKRQPGNMKYTFNVYSLKEDLYGCRVFKGDLHLHTYESDGLQDVTHSVGNLRAAGFDFLGITDHFLMEPSRKARAIYQGVPVDMTLLTGEEVHVPTERIHAVHIGGNASINEDFRARKEEAAKEVEQIQANLPDDLPAEINREDYAWRLWIAKRARDFGGLSILAHPHWVWQTVYFMAEPITYRLLRDGVYDALELLNFGQEVDTMVALWGELRAEGLRFPVVGSSDGHNNDMVDERTPSNCYTMIVAPTRDEKELIAAIRDERTVAVDASSGRPRLYGSYRLVKYIQFVMDQYMPVYMSLCYAQGRLMMEWAMAKDEQQKAHLGELLTALNERSERFAREFFLG